MVSATKFGIGKPCRSFIRLYPPGLHMTCWAVRYTSQRACCDVFRKRGGLYAFSTQAILFWSNWQATWFRSFATSMSSRYDRFVRRGDLWADAKSSSQSHSVRKWWSLLAVSYHSHALHWAHYAAPPLLAFVTIFKRSLGERRIFSVSVKTMPDASRIRFFVSSSCWLLKANYLTGASPPGWRSGPHRGWSKGSPPWPGRCPEDLPYLPASGPVRKDYLFILYL